MKTVLALLMASAGAAAADHDHDHVQPRGTALGVTGSLGAIAGAYESTFFTGDYQGLAAAIGISERRFAVSAGIAGYRLTRNGKRERGAGDTTLHGRLLVLERGRLSAGVALGVMLPTGDEAAGLGMGHAMVMPGAFGAWTGGRTRLVISAGYGRGIGDESAHAEHGGAWPLVEPMSFEEVTFGAVASYALAEVLRAGLRVSGAAPLGDGATRLSGGVRASWVEGRVETSFELAAGLAGDPYTLRGTLATSLRFE